jgi:hypothetical protein
MTITRDAWLFYLAFAGTVLGYVAAAENTPNLWTFKEWVQLALVAVAWLTGKLQTSPLPGENDPKVNADRKRGEVVMGSMSGPDDAKGTPK